MALASSARVSSSVQAAPRRTAPVARPSRSAFAPFSNNKRQLAVVRAAEVVAGVTDDTFAKEVLASPVPVLVDFWAPWCGPCRMIAPLIDELAVEYSGKIKCVKLNTDESPGVATEYGIRSIPTVIVFKNGEKMETVIGAVPKSTLVQTIEKFL